MDPHQIRSMCCRLRLDLTELTKRGNGLFGSAEQTGSIGVVTINCARLGYEHAGNWDSLIVQLDKLLELTKQSLEIKRKIIQHYIDNGLFPYTLRYLKNLDNHFSTIGVNGINEMIRNYTAFGEGEEFDIADDRGEKMAVDLIDHIRAKLLEFQEETGRMYNLEATPAEGTTYRFAKEDKDKHPDIIQAGTEDHPYYTNSSQLPVGYTNDPFEALAKQEVLQSKYTGGTVLHLYMGERISDAKVCKEFMKRALSQYRLPYVTITPTFSISPINGYLPGEYFFDPKYDEEHGLDENSPEDKRVRCEVWTRVMGYFRPVSSFNVGKKGEFIERTPFNEPQFEGFIAPKVPRKLSNRAGQHPADETAEEREKRYTNISYMS
jgi:ribonucleoside-triphosphate reductase